MFELELQKYLRSGKNLEELNSELAIRCRRHQKFPNLVSFKYDQLDSPRNHPVVVECRGTILDEDKNWSVVAYPFKRFFNADEGYAAELDWNNAVVQEKLDGSFCIMFWYNKTWHVATSGSADAGGSVGDLVEWRENGMLIEPRPKSFAEYFWLTGNKCFGAEWFRSAKTNHCYMFELMGPLNRVVVYHEKAHIVCIGGRNLSTMEEIPAYEAARHLGVPAVKEYNLSSLDLIIKTFADVSPLSQEGYVVHNKTLSEDKCYARNKIKNPAYVAIHHAKDGLTTKAFVEIARQGEVSEMIAHFPEYKPMLDDAKQRFESLVKELQDDYNEIKNINNQKEFALKAIGSRCSGALFAYRAKKVGSITEFLRQMHIGKIMALLGYKDND